MSPAPAQVEGHALRLITQGPALLGALLDLIAGATRSLRLVYYIFEDDASGGQVLAALLAARARGVDVALLVDGFGSSDAEESFFAPLRECGSSFCRYEPTKSRRYLIRNHQKFAIADEARALVGGFNVADDYFGEIAGGGWRDLGLLVEGAAPARLAAYFDALHDWMRRPGARARDLRLMLEAHSEQDGAVRWMLGGPTYFLSPWAVAARLDMACARRVSMVAAYFGPGRSFLRLIGVAAARGDARVVTAAKSDNNATIAAARHTYRRLLRERVRVFEYQPTKLHTKLFVFDDVVYIGSANFDRRSIFINCEIMLRIKDRAFADLVDAYVSAECAQSIEMTPARYAERRTIANVVRWTLSHLVVSVLDYNVSRRLNFGLDGG